MKVNYTREGREQPLLTNVRVCRGLESTWNVWYRVHKVYWKKLLPLMEA